MMGDFLSANCLKRMAGKTRLESFSENISGRQGQNFIRTLLKSEIHLNSKSAPEGAFLGIFLQKFA
jgi:hypothetical protein